MNSGNARLALLCVAQFVVVLDVTIVAIALPAIGRDLGFEPAGLQWVLTAYTLTFGGGLLLAGPGRRPLRAAAGVPGRAARVRRRRRSPARSRRPPRALIAARAVQGIGAALVAPSALALLVATEPAGRARVARARDLDRRRRRRRRVGLGARRRDHERPRVGVGVRGQRAGRARRRRAGGARCSPSPRGRRGGLDVPGAVDADARRSPRAARLGLSDGPGSVPRCTARGGRAARRLRRVSGGPRRSSPAGALRAPGLARGAPRRARADRDHVARDVPRHPRRRTARTGCCSLPSTSP